MLFDSSVEFRSLLLQQLLNQVLEFGKAESREILPKWEMVDLHTFLQSLSANGIALSAGTPLTFRMGSKIPATSWRGDPHLTRQVLLNLLDNAFKYTERGEIQLRVAIEGEETLCFEVEDSGIGIHEELLNEIFKPFVRLEQDHQKHVRGTGLGLAIVQQLTRAIQGTLNVESSPGRGTIVALRIPLRPKENLPS